MRMGASTVIRTLPWLALAWAAALVPTASGADAYNLVVRSEAHGADSPDAFAPLTEDIDLAWSPSGFDEPMSYTVEGDCVWMHKRFFGDAGIARIAPWVWEEHPIGEGCTAELTLRRQPFQQGARDWQTFASVGAMVERRDQVSLRLAP